MPYTNKADRAAFDISRYYNRRHKIIDQLGGGCSSCNTKNNLEIHHIDPAKKGFALSRKWTTPWNVIQQELQKCKLLCKSCHIKEHAPQHGMRSMYNKGCRCDLCRKTHRDYFREWRARKSDQGQMVSRRSSKP